MQMTEFYVFIIIYEAMGREEASFSCYKSQTGYVHTFVSKVRT